MTTLTRKSMTQLLASLNLYQHAKNQFIPSVHFWDKVNFRVPWPDWSHPFFTVPTQKIFDQLLVFANLYQHAKKSFTSSVHSSYTVNFRVLQPDWPHSFLIMLTTKSFNHLLICMNFCRQAKNWFTYTAHWFPMISNDFQWHSLNTELQWPSFPNWAPLSSTDSHWDPMTPNDPEWALMTPNDLQLTSTYIYGAPLSRNDTH